MGGFRAQQDDDGMHGHPMVSEEQRVVRQQIGMLPSGGARLEIEVNDFFEGFTDAQQWRVPFAALLVVALVSCSERSTRGAGTREQGDAESQ